MKTFSIILSLVATVILSSSCTNPEPSSVEYSDKPDPMTDAEYETKIESRIRELLNENKLSRSEAKLQAEREIDRENWKRKSTPVDLWELQSGSEIANAEQRPKIEDVANDAHKAFSSMLLMTRNVDEKKDISVGLDLPEFTVPIQPKRKEMLKSVMHEVFVDEVFKTSENAHFFGYNQLSPEKQNYYYVLMIPGGSYGLVATTVTIDEKTYLHDVVIIKEQSRILECSEKYGYKKTASIRPFRY